MRNSVALHMSIALGAFVLLQGQTGSPGCGEGNANPTPTNPEVCNGTMQTVRLAPGMSSPITRCSRDSASTDDYPAAEFSSEIASAAPPSWVTVEFRSFQPEEAAPKPVLAVGATMDAAVGSTTQLTFEVKNGSTVSNVPVKVEVVDFAAAIEPDSDVTTRDGQLYARANVPFSLQAKVYGPPVDYAYTWSWKLETAPSGEELVTDSRASFSLAPGRYDVSLVVAGAPIGEKTASTKVEITAGQFSAQIEDAPCPAEAVACERGMYRTCARAVARWWGEGDAPTADKYTYSFSAIDGTNTVRDVEPHGRDLVSVCKNTGDSVTLRAVISRGGVDAVVLRQLH